MKAAVVERYGPPEVAVIREVPKPVPGDDEVLIRVHASTVNSGDARVRAQRVPRGYGLMIRLVSGFSRPKQPIFGLDVAGEIEAVGKNVRGFTPGQRVIASRGFAAGGHAEYLAVKQSAAIAVIPEGMSYADAVSLCFGGSTALVFFQLGGLKAGETILINGSSGAVGTFAVQLAKHLGAEVTAVCSAANAGLVRSLGASHVIDYAVEDFTESGKTYDVIMDNHGNGPFSRIKHLLKPGGRLLMVIGDLFQMIGSIGQKAIIKVVDDSPVNAESYRALLQLAASGAVKPVIGARFPLERIADAYALVDGGHKTGSVVLDVV